MKETCLFKYDQIATMFVFINENMFMKNRLKDVLFNEKDG